MQDQARLYQLHANCNAHKGYVQLRVTLSVLSKEGFEGEPKTWRHVAQVPWIDSEVDQAWAILVTMLHMLESQGAMGRVSAGDWPGLW